MFDDIGKYLEHELSEALEPLPCVSISVVWIDDEWLHVTAWVGPERVIDDRVWASVLTGADMVRSILWRHRLVLLDQMRRRGANPRILNQVLLDCDAYSGPSLV
ncbi:hypothetical protein [Primorskyibacter sp. S87]|uniref:hypothetical protein n=1 Tax=Primorskyibacter sp. S87 TaxID=3415126 RepID=UPI003C7DA56B